MPFQNLSINRLIIHEVFRRGEVRELVEPRYSSQLIELDTDARDELQLRITSALGHASHGVEMTICDATENSTWVVSKAIIASQEHDAEFVAKSQIIASKLAAAQTARTIPGGIVVVIDGTAGHPAQQFMCVIKAEPHGGFTKRESEDGNLLLEYLRDLILTPQAKLYKIGAFSKQDATTSTNPVATDGWRAFLFDDLITTGNKLGAAQYFYESFLGLTFPTNSAFQTKQFHSYTKEFIRSASVSEEKKYDLLNALTTYLKTDQAATVQVQAFATNYLHTPELRDAYTTHMAQKKFPMTAIHKDLAEVKSALRQRKLFFSNNIKLTAPADQFEDHVRIRSIDGEPDEHGNIPKWTEIIVHDRIRNQE
ncbi:MAG: nucleoid-associated protein [Gallionellaceae bacterium]|nr:nucleoid-associated protein [Gallionellaceae bacterium]